MCHLLEKRPTSRDHFSTANYGNVLIFIVLQRFVAAVDCVVLRDLIQFRMRG